VFVGRVDKLPAHLEEDFAHCNANFDGRSQAEIVSFFEGVALPGKNVLPNPFYRFLILFVAEPDVHRRIKPAKFVAIACDSFEHL
jgi:hypothetical protein